MDVCRTAAEDITRMSDHRKTSNDVDQWQRWDEELVEDYKLYFDEISKHGYNGTMQWGLLAGHWHPFEDKIVFSK